MSNERVERRLTAILAADVAGYSRLTGLDEEATHARLQDHLRSLVDPKIAEHRGRVVKNTGDGLLAEFGTVVDAVRCAVDVQRGMAERNAEVPQDTAIAPSLPPPPELTSLSRTEPQTSRAARRRPRCGPALSARARQKNHAGGFPWVLCPPRMSIGGSDYRGSPMKTFLSLTALAVLVLVTSSNISSYAQAQDAGRTAKCMARCKEECDRRAGSEPSARKSGCMNHCQSLFNC